MVIPAFATHLCLGAPWAWSVVADGAKRNVGFVAPAAADWSLMEAAFPLSIVFVMQGVCAALVGNWQIKEGPRKSLLVSSALFGGGMVMAAAGLHLHNIALLYSGTFFLGSGMGFGYTLPVQTLIQWFPDKKGLAGE